MFEVIKLAIYGIILYREAARPSVYELSIYLCVPSIGDCIHIQALNLWHEYTHKYTHTTLFIN